MHARRTRAFVSLASLGCVGGIQTKPQSRPTFGRRDDDERREGGRGGFRGRDGYRGPKRTDGDSFNPEFVSDGRARCRRGWWWLSACVMTWRLALVLL